MKLAVVTVNFHNQNETIDCIHSLEKFCGSRLNVVYFVVNNEGDDLSSNCLKKTLPNAKIITSNINLGFGAGTNLGISEALKQKSDYVLVVNPDTVVESKNFLKKLIKEETDIVAPLIKYKFRGKNVFDFGGKVDYIFGRNTHLTSDKNTYDSAVPDYFSGACLLIKSDVFNKIGMFDEKFFLYYEDVDFCLRAKSFGLSQKLCQKAVIFHHLSTTTNKLGAKKLSILAQSHLRFCQKHLSIFVSPLYISFNIFLKFKSALLSIRSMVFAVPKTS